MVKKLGIAHVHTTLSHVCAAPPRPSLLLLLPRVTAAPLVCASPMCTLSPLSVHRTALPLPSPPSFPTRVERRLGPGREGGRVGERVPKKEGGEWEGGPVGERVRKRGGRRVREWPSGKARERGRVGKKRGGRRVREWSSGRAIVVERVRVCQGVSVVAPISCALRRAASV